MKSMKPTILCCCGVDIQWFDNCLVLPALATLIFSSGYIFTISIKVNKVGLALNCVFSIVVDGIINTLLECELLDMYVDWRSMQHQEITCYLPVIFKYM